MIKAHTPLPAGYFTCFRIFAYLFYPSGENLGFRYQGGTVRRFLCAKREVKLLKFINYYSSPINY